MQCGWRLFLLPEPKGGIGRADHLSRMEIHGDNCYPGNQTEGPKRKKQPPLGAGVTIVRGLSTTGIHNP